MKDQKPVFPLFVGLPKLIFLVNLEHNLAVLDWVVLELGECLLIDEQTTFITA